MANALEDEPKQTLSVPRIHQEAQDLLVLKWWENQAGNTALIWDGRRGGGEVRSCALTCSMEGGNHNQAHSYVACVSDSRVSEEQRDTVILGGCRLAMELVGFVILF